ncbi:MAG: hypothetical protein OEU51_05620 [Gammaproteobacteria bacterium]|jgi:hypothetical protein|nr:hypothetical protein [Gammaproteobacteria bacterium]
MTGLRRVAYTISALAVACFFLFPEPDVAIIGALLLQTLAFVIIAGKSSADGIVLTGVTVLLMGFIPADHPLIRGPFFEAAKPWIVTIGIAVIVSGLLLVSRQYHNRF